MVVDPRKTPTGAQADVWLAPKPHTDLALVLALLHHIVDRKLFDRAFVEKWVLGFDELTKHLHDYTPEWAAEICDLPADKIRRWPRITRKPGRRRFFAMPAFRTRWVPSTPIALWLFWRRSPAISACPAAAATSCTTPGRAICICRALKEKTPEIKSPELPVGPDWFAESILHSRPYQLRALITMGNPLLASANTKKVQEAFAKLEFYVYTGMFLEESAYYADIVLPVCSGLEMETVYMRRDDRAIRWQKQAVDRVGESKPDWEIWIDLAHAIAKLDKKNPPAYWADAFPKEWADYRKLWATFISLTPGTQGMTAERMAARTEPLRWPCPSEKHPGVSTLYLDHPTWYEAAEALDPKNKGKRFLTPSGKIEIYTPEQEKKLAATGHTALPAFYTHPEVTGKNPILTHAEALVDNPVNPGSVTPRAVRGTSTGAVHKEFPLMGMSGRPSVVHFASVLQWTQGGKDLNGIRFVQIHPKSAEKAGVKDGDKVIVESPRIGNRHRLAVAGYARGHDLCTRHVRSSAEDGRGRWRSDVYLSQHAHRRSLVRQPVGPAGVQVLCLPGAEGIAPANLPLRSHVVNQVSRPVNERAYGRTWPA